ncbi:hypothetical protein U9M48_022311 [Paspalum notatum var. saurae]|uniref:xyloglucan:xyloglucosyl transferase n=1 Tax=Paspalum notatum var. saurae TaxID=547442 RepID=A0AAQ3THE9_PASNO
MAAKARFLLLTGLLAAATWVCLSAVAASAFDVPAVAFGDRFSPLFGDGNLVRSGDDRSVRLLLDRRSGSGFISSDYYLHGFFSASIKLPKDYTAGVVVAFYVSVPNRRRLPQHLNISSRNIPSQSETFFYHRNISGIPARRSFGPLVRAWSHGVSTRIHRQPPARERHRTAKLCGCAHVLRRRARYSASPHGLLGLCSPERLRRLAPGPGNKCSLFRHSRLSNGDVYEKTHDELDFEFLGSRWGGQWRVQTNVYGNGSTSHGREERYLLPFDPTLEAHRYSVLWTPTHIIFYIDDTPIREVIRHPDMGGDFPAKPMAVYATIWDGSTWATDGGKYKVNYKYAPFASEFTDLAVVGSRADPVLRVPRRGGGADQEELLGLMTADYALMTPQKRAAMRAFRARHMTYTVCYDAVRYAAAFPECDNSDEEREAFWAWGESKTVVMKTRGRGRRRGRKAGAGARARSDVASS